MNLWDKGVKPDSSIIEFTAGSDREYDNLLAGWDIAGSMAHVLMLSRVGLIGHEDKHSLMTGLNSLFNRYLRGGLKVTGGVEDIHTLVEDELSKINGPSGKKVHTGRSRNDQVLTDIRLYTRYETDLVAEAVHRLVTKLTALSEKYREVMLPGYTHMQPAMVSTFGMWFGSYAEALTDDLVMLSAARKINNRCPLGTAAGYGSTLPLDRDYTACLLGFDGIIFNSAYASLNRGKAEYAVTSALASVAGTLSKFAADITLFMMAELRFVEFPDELITGSSIMPQKKNPDVFEIIRARSNSVISAPNEVRLIAGNLPSGYHRDLQELKRIVIRSFTGISECLEILHFMLGGIRIREDLISSSLYDHIFSTEEVYRLVREGMPFREAYAAVAERLKEADFPRTSVSDYTHKGSAGNLCNDLITERADQLLKEFISPGAPALVKSLMEKAELA